MIFKRFLIFNSCIAILCSAISYSRYHLYFQAIPFHLLLVSMGLMYFSLACILIANSTQKRKIALPLLMLFIFLSQLVLLIFYSGYFIGNENWGRPITWGIYTAYAKDITAVLSALPFSASMIGVFIAVVISCLSFPLFIWVPKMYAELQFKRATFYAWPKPVKLLVLAAIILPLLLVQTHWAKYRIDRYGLYDPILSIWFYHIQDEQVNDWGLKNIEAKKAYPQALKFKHKNVVLIICDALRADHLSLYGYPRKTSPFLDSFCAQHHGIYLKQFYATSSRSFIGISNILSARYTISNNNFFIHDVLKSQGYAINFLLSGDHTNFYGLKQSYGKNIDNYWDGYSGICKDAAVSMNNDSDIVVNQLQQIKPYQSTANFFYLHFMSTHQLGVLQQQFNVYKPNEINLTTLRNQQTNEALVNNYDNRIIQLDHYLKQCFQKLAVKGYLNDAIIIITADHGQALGEGGRYFHGNSTYASEIDVPFIFIETGKPSKVDLSYQDFNNQLAIAPTIADALQIPVPLNWEGRSIFNPHPPTLLFQHEDPYFSVITKNKDAVFQYVYQSSTQTAQYFNWSKGNMFNSQNIIAQQNEQQMAQLKKAVVDFYFNKDAHK